MYVATRITLLTVVPLSYMIPDVRHKPEYNKIIYFTQVIQLHIQFYINNSSEIIHAGHYKPYWYCRKKPTIGAIRTYILVGGDLSALSEVSQGFLVTDKQILTETSFQDIIFH